MCACVVRGARVGAVVFVAARVEGVETTVSSVSARSVDCAALVTRDDFYDIICFRSSRLIAVFMFFGMRDRASSYDLRLGSRLALTVVT